MDGRLIKGKMSALFKEICRVDTISLEVQMVFSIEPRKEFSSLLEHPCLSTTHKQNANS